MYFVSQFKKRKKLTVRRRLQSAFQKQVEKEIPLWKKIYLLWSAPITTFWVTQVWMNPNRTQMLIMNYYFKLKNTRILDTQLILS